jgi:hypothetical protein
MPLFGLLKLAEEVGVDLLETWHLTRAPLNFGAVPCHKASDPPLRVLPPYYEFA